MQAEVKDFIYAYAKMIASASDKISVSEFESDGFREIIVYAQSVDAGRLIGKGGKVISACKNIAVSNKSVQKANYKITVKTLDEQP